MTHYSAHTEFDLLSSAGIVLVDETEPADDGFFFDGSAGWAKLGDCQMDQAVKHLRSVHATKQSGALRFNSVGFNLFTKVFTWANAADRIIQTLGA
jgi:hypothetical protein